MPQPQSMPGGVVMLLAACLGTILALASGSATGGVPGHRVSVGFVPPTAAPRHFASSSSSSSPSAGNQCRGTWQASRLLAGSSMAGCGQGYPPTTLPGSFAASLQGMGLRQLGEHHGEAAANSGGWAGSAARRGGSGGVAARGRANSLQLRMTASAEDRKAGFQGVGPAQGGWGISVGIEDEEERLPEDENFLRGSLPNGLRYSIKRNKMPRGRFLVNLEVHSGSVDEDEDEQGIAHFLEHMLFLGTDKFPTPDAMRTVLGKLGMSQLADANAYTDFRSTVYTLSAPTRGEDVRGKFDMESSSSAANRDTLFRSGLVSAPVTIQTIMPTEAQDEDEGGDEEEGEGEEEEEENGNGGEENSGAAGEEETNVRLVIDLLHQMSFKALIRQESVDSERGAILNEYRDTKDLSDRVASKYYRQMFAETALPERFPIGKEELIKTFDSAQIKKFYDKHYHPSNMHIFVVGDIDEDEALEHITSIFGSESETPRHGDGGGLPGLTDTPERGPMSMWPVRGADIHHDFGERVGVPFQSVTHGQITDFSLTVTVKEALESNDRVRHLREGMLDTLTGMALGFRTDEVVSIADDPPFTRVDWNYFNSAREGCVLNSITVSGEARNWREAVREGVREVRRLERHGITEEELELLKKTLMGHYRQDAEQEETTPSGEWMEELMESAETGSSFIASQQAYDLAQKLLPTITLDAVNARVRQLYGFSADGEPHQLFVTAPAGWDEGPVTEAEIRALIREAESGADAYTFGEQVPDFLTDGKAIEGGEEPKWSRVDEGVEGRKGTRSSDGLVVRDDKMGVTLKRMANGVCLSYKKTKYDMGQVHIHITAAGGRALEGVGGEGGEKRSALAIGLQALCGSGLGNYSASLMQKFCALHEMDYTASCDGERAAVDITFSSANEGCTRRAMELARVLMTGTDVDPKALKRSQRAHRTDFESNARTLEGACGNALWESTTMTSKGRPDSRYLSVMPDDVDQVTAEEATAVIRRQLAACGLEVVVLGDFDEDELEREALVHLGSLPRGERAAPGKESKVWSVGMRGGTQVRVRVKDDVERTSIMMIAPCINRWGKAGDLVDLGDEYPGGREAYERIMEEHGQMLANRCLVLAQDIVNNRLYERIREQKGMVYSVGMSWDPMFVMDKGFVSVQLMPFPEKIQESSDAVMAVLRELTEEGFTQEEFDAVKKPVIKEIRESLESNSYWTSLIEGLQSGGLQPKTLDSIQDIPEMYDSISMEQVLSIMRGAIGAFEKTAVVLHGVSGDSYDGVEVDVL